MNPLVLIAARNLLLHRRRTLTAALAITLGFAAVNVFGGFTRYMNRSLRDGFVYSQAQGHLTVFREGFLEKGSLDPARYLFSRAETESLTALLLRRPEVALVTPQLQFSGLLSNGEVSTIFVASGRVPSDVDAIQSRARGFLGDLALYAGEPLRDEAPYRVGLATGLAALLDIDLEEGAIAVAPTVAGRVNALDVTVAQLFETSMELLNDKAMTAPLDLAWELLDTRSADRLTVLLHRTEDTDRVAALLRESLAGRGLEVRTWETLSLLYARVRTMFDLIFVFLFVIVLVVASMSVFNTINMAILERTREIGTLRALGMRGRRILVLFAVESGILGVLGSLLGLALTLAAWLAVKVAAPTWIPPMITKRVPIEIHLVPEHLWVSFTFLLGLSVLAACLPARRAVKQGIVRSLGHA